MSSSALRRCREASLYLPSWTLWRPARYSCSYSSTLLKLYPTPLSAGEYLISLCQRPPSREPTRPELRPSKRFDPDWWGRRTPTRQRPRDSIPMPLPVMNRTSFAVTSQRRFQEWTQDAAHTQAPRHLNNTGFPSAYTPSQLRSVVDVTTISRDLLIIRNHLYWCVLRRSGSLANLRCLACNVMSQLHQERAKCLEQVSMTGQEFLIWLEQCSMAALCKSSLGLQVGVMGAEIMDVNAELFKTAIERLADLNTNSSTRSAPPAEPQDQAVRRSAYGAWYGEH